MTAGPLAWLATPRGAAAAALVGALAAAALSLSGGPLGAAAARAALAVAALGAVAVLARRAPARAASPAPLAVLARAPLGREAGLAVVEAGGRRLLVGHAQGGIRVLADLSDRGGAP